MALQTLIDELLTLARARRHRRLLVLQGDRDCALRALATTLPGTPLLVAPRQVAAPAGWDHADPAEVGQLLGRTLSCIVLDLHPALSPNLLGALSGLVAGGGLLVLLHPDPRRWPTLPDAFADRLALPGFPAERVGRRFLARFLASLQRARALAVVDAASGALLQRVEDPAPPGPPAVGEGGPAADGVGAPQLEPRAEVLDRLCRSADQAAALRALAPLGGAQGAARAAVLVADRGRGKSSALGLFAAGQLVAGRELVVTGPGPEAVAEIFARAREGVAALGAAVLRRTERELVLDAPPGQRGGSLTYHHPPDAAAHPGELLLVDEAAALPVPLLDRLLGAAGRIAFSTTVHGYEGTGRGFDVRFRAHLEADGRPLTRLTLHDPIRWAAGDPVEAWCADALLLGAGPASDAAVAGAAAPRTEYLAPGQTELGAAGPLLAEAFGLLTLAHYRTTPEDLARMLDAPNLHTRLLLHGGHVVAVALIAEEGRLDAETVAGLYLGRHRIRGHMLPEALVSHLGEEAAGALGMARVVRLAVHPALRQRGLGRALLEWVAAELTGRQVALFGTGFAATAGLLAFWRRCGFVPVRLGVTRSAVSGEHSVVMLRGLQPDASALVDELGRRFARSVPHILGDALRDLEPAVALAALAAANRAAPAELEPWEWEDLVAATFGHRLYDVAVRPVWELVRAYLGDPCPPVELDARQRQRLLLKVLQRRRWSEVAGLLGEELHPCMRALRQALAPLVEAYLPAAHRPLIDRFRGARARHKRGER